MLRAVSSIGGAALNMLPDLDAISNPAIDTVAVVINGVPAQLTFTEFVAAVGTSLASLNSAGTLADADLLAITQDGTNEVKVTLGTLKAYVGTGGSGDTTAPTLSSPTGTATGTTTASGTVSTNEGNGTLYWLASANATESVATVKAGFSQGVSATGAQNVTVTGLTASTSYYLHYVHTDAAANNSSVANSAQFTTSAAGDTTAPTLSSPTGTKTGSTTATGTVSTNEANGALYYLASTNATESAATVKAAASQSVSATGVQNVSFTGLTASTTYYAHYVHRDAAGNDSTVSNSASFTTDASGTAYTITGYSGNAVRSSIDASSAPVFSPLKQISPSNNGLNQQTVNPYWNINATTGGAQPASAKCGWGTSPTVPPAEITTGANGSSGSSVNGMAPMNKAAAFENVTNLWVNVGSGTTTWYFWIKPVDGPAQCMNPSGTTVTGA
jgi:hypothetical protein